MSGLIPATGIHIVDDGWWLALTGVPDPSYNLALIHGSDVRKNTSDVIERILAEKHRSVIMLAGLGLGAGTVLSDAGWVCVGSSSLRMLPNSPSELDPQVKVLDEEELGAARGLVGEIFNVDPASAALVYTASSSEGHSRRSVIGLVEDGALQAAAMLSFGHPISTGWAGGTRPTSQRRGHGMRVLQQASAIAFAEVGEGSLCFLASDASNRLYDVAGAEIVEYWQMWSRPRWLLGS
ncbi:N-acetyltransferase [Rhodococcus sp. ARC_M6]|uniref:N-acetyltransferase n=1 Tax=Rhodococcus sp. ARC_M6 TaxID=2928852 RepID=UPI001FB252A4|nr:N-acetyltransferase [Rhodococcus sp. ARC_M6]MCJ0904085.1 N-acetyltransferase [Rhodococcus sp. ARC_M6]